MTVGSLSPARFAAVRPAEPSSWQAPGLPGAVGTAAASSALGRDAPPRSVHAGSGGGRAAAATAATALCLSCGGRRRARRRRSNGGRVPARAVTVGAAALSFGAAPSGATAPAGSSAEFPAPAPGSAPNGKTAIVIGAGVGGLAMAGRLARAGFDVRLLEKNSSAGGRMRSELFGAQDKGLEGHRFDTGPSLLLFPEKYREAFAALGARLEDHVQLRRVEPTAMRVHFAEDSTSMDLLYDSEAMRRQLEEEEPGAGKQYFRWLGEARASLDLGLKAFIEQDSTSALDFVDLTRVGPLALAVNPVLLLGPQTWQLATHFKSEKVKALFSYQHLYVGLRPQNAPGVFSLLAATELTDGIWYPCGGFATVRDGLERLANAHGVKMQFDTEVAQILVEETSSGFGESLSSTRRARGVRLASGEDLSADVVVANPDLPYVYDELLRGQYKKVEEEAAQLRDELEYSCGMIEFCWALREPLPELTQHNVFLGADYKGSWDRPCTAADFRERDSFNFYVHRPTYTDTSAAPSGEDNIMIELPIGNGRERAEAAKRAGLSAQESEEELIAAARAAMLRQFDRMGYSAGGKSVGELIKGERILSPSEWERRYNLTHGAVFGLSHGLLQLACFRPPRQTGIDSLDAQKVEGLHFVGASTRPGNGVPLVLMGVATAFENVIAEQGVDPGPGALPLAPMAGPIPEHASAHTPSEPEPSKVAPKATAPMAAEVTPATA